MDFQTSTHSTRWLPKIPLFGPAAQLSPGVLLSKFGEMGTVTGGRPAAGGRGEARDPRPLALPKLGGSLSARGAPPPQGARPCALSGSLSARVANEGLATLLYKGDHTLRLKELDYGDEPTLEGVSRQPARGVGGPSPASSEPRLRSKQSSGNSRVSSKMTTLDSPPAASRHDRMSNEPSVMRSAGSKEFHRAGSKESKTIMTQAQIQAQLRASFKHGEREIEVALQAMNRWSVRTKTNPPFDQNGSDPRVQELSDKFRQCDLQSLVPRCSGQNRITPCGDGDEAPFTGRPDEQACLHDSGIEVGMAPRSEVAACIVVLNFVRWLCGLPTIEHDESRKEVCNIINQALVPRVTDVKRFQKSPKDLAGALEELFGRAGGGRVALFHGEGSLASAVENAILATHMVNPPFQPPTVSEAANEAAVRLLARRAETDREAKNNDRERHGSSRKIVGPPEPVVGIHELPAALNEFRIFWQLQVLEHASGRGGSPGRGASQQQQARAGQLAEVLPSPRARPGALEPLLESPMATASPRRFLPVASLAAAIPSSSLQKSPSTTSIATTTCSRPARRCRVVPADLSLDDGKPSSYGLSEIWGDKHGALAMRRCLLNPSLRSFGASRQHDTCVLWTGSSPELFSTIQQEIAPGRPEHGKTKLPLDLAGPLEHANAEASRIKEARAAYLMSRKLQREEETKKVASIDAVSFPPAGIVPMFLLEGGAAPWTILPNSSRFQPTSSTRVRVWRSRIDRREWNTERLAEVGVRGLAVDCSLQGDPFCVIFWPDIRKAKEGDQFEVQLSGLTGDGQELTFFYEFRAFGMTDCDRGFIAEAARFRSLLGSSSLWPAPTPAAPHELKLPQCPHPPDIRNIAPAPPEPRRDRRTSDQLVPGRGLPSLPGSSSARSMVEEVMAPPIETMSHHNRQLMTKSVDMAITLRSEAIAVLDAELVVMRFGEGEESVPNGAQVQKLKDGVFVIVVKLPMARCRYELRFWASRVQTPLENRRHPFKYMITTADQCQTLLGSLDDPLLDVFGLARIATEAQHHGIYILAPTTRRVLVGSCYFLVYVNEARALARAKEVAAKAFENSKPTLCLRAPVETDKPVTTLFSKRLLQQDSFGGPHPEVLEMHELLRPVFEPWTQDVRANIHVQLATSDGLCRRQLRPRHDFRDFYEAQVTFTEAEAMLGLRLQLRFPKIQAAEFSPTTICEWTVCRSEHFPIGF